MSTLSRAAGPLTLVLALAFSLSACSDDGDGEDPASDASSQTCRLAAAAHASLDGPRDSVARGFFGPAMAAYDTAVARLSEAVASEDEPEPEVTEAVLALVGAYSRTRAFAGENAGASSYQSNEAKALTAAEERLYGQLVEVCPVLDGTTDDD